MFPCLKCPSNYGNLNLTTQVVSETLDAENSMAKVIAMAVLQF